MATWHQLRRPVRLDHPTEWSVVIDPPHGTRCIMGFTDETRAREYAAKSPHAYVLPPRG